MSLKLKFEDKIIYIIKENNEPVGGVFLKVYKDESEVKMQNNKFIITKKCKYEFYTVRGNRKETFKIIDLDKIQKQEQIPFVMIYAQYLVIKTEGDKANVYDMSKNFELIKTFEGAALNLIARPVKKGTIHMFYWCFNKNNTPHFIDFKTLELVSAEKQKMIFDDCIIGLKIVSLIQIRFYKKIYFYSSVKTDKATLSYLYLKSFSLFFKNQIQSFIFYLMCLKRKKIFIPKAVNIGQIFAKLV